MTETFALSPHKALVARFAGKVEFAAHFSHRPSIAHVVLDFDGTLSLIREGWPEVMLPMFEELLPRVDGEEPEAVRAMLWDDIMTLNGRQTIYQMMKFAERVTERGGEALEPLQYKHNYLHRLELRIQSRVDQLAKGDAEPVDFLLHGALSLVDGMVARGWRLYLASGTDEPFVKREAELLSRRPMPAQKQGRPPGQVADLRGVVFLTQRGDGRQGLGGPVESEQRSHAVNLTVIIQAPRF